MSDEFNGLPLSRSSTTPPRPEASESGGSTPSIDLEDGGRLQPPPLPWPPPGLERLHGAIPRVCTWLEIGSLVTVLPILATLQLSGSPWSYGPLGAAWWLVPALTVAGLAILGIGALRLFLTLRSSARANDRGYAWTPILSATIDGRRDAGFLLQGARMYSPLTPSRRRSVLRLRLAIEMARLTAAGWAPVAMAFGIPAMARDLLSEPGLWLMTLGPVLALALVGMMLRGWEWALLLSARRAWEPGRRYRSGHLASQWNRTAGGVIGDPLEFLGRRGKTALRMASIIVLLAAVAVGVTQGTLLAAGVLGPVVAGLVGPRVQPDGATSQLAELEDFAAAPSEKSDPVQAGEALHSLFHAGAHRGPDPMERTPVRTQPHWWDSPPIDRIPPHRWSTDLMDAAALGLSRRDLEELEPVVEHPAHEEFATVANADRVDVVGTRWDLPFPDEVSAFELPIPRYTELRQGAWAHVARAAVELHNGEFYEAERTLQEVVSLGLRLANDGPLPVDAAVGSAIARDGMDGLVSLFEATDRAHEAELARRARRVTERSPRAAGRRFRNIDPAYLQERVLDPRVPIGERWEAFTYLNTVAPCLNMRSALLGAGEAYEIWLAEARLALVQDPSDEALFQLLRRGYVGSREGTHGWGWLPRALELTLSEREVAGRCAPVAATLYRAGAVALRDFLDPGGPIPR